MDRIYYINVLDEVDCITFRFNNSAQYHEKLYALTNGHRLDFDVAVKEHFTVSNVYL